MESFFDLKDVIPPPDREKSLHYFYELFGNHNPLIVEIGSGNGHFLVQWALSHPEKNFIGTEILLGRAKKAHSKVESNNSQNVVVFRGDTRRFIWDFLYEDTIEEFIILFPDPWPKRRHHKNRLLDRRFIRMLLFRLRPGGAISVATDYEEYRDFILEEFREVKGLTCSFEKGYSNYPEDYPISIYEERLRKEGMSLYYMRFVNNACTE